MSRLEWVLGGTLVVLLVVAIVLGLLFWRQPDLAGRPPSLAGDAPAAPTSVLEGKTALLAYIPAREQARAWQPDARLLKAEATWPQGSHREDLLEGAATWNFTFYSPGTASIVSIPVIENEASLAGEREVETPLSPLDASGWRIDSNEAVRLMLQEGGDAFLQGAGTSTLTAALTTDNESERIEWFLSLFAVNSRQSFTVRLDANSGEVLEVQQPS